MSTLARLMLVVTLLLCAVASRASAQPLPSDRSLVTGELDNGLKYIVRKHANPTGRATMWVHMHTGSLNETDRQRGIAHYLEHMAFNGSANFPPGSLVPFFQSLGMTFGRDQNAFTNMHQTTFQLSLPDAKPETLAKGMMFFSDIVTGLSLLPSEIDNERQIIQEERRRGLSGRQRTSFYVLEHIAPGSIYGQRITIGTEETINGVNEQDFHDYYGKWYAASNATLMVVADAEPEAVIQVIKDKFGSAAKRPRPTPQAAGVKPYDKSFAIVASDPEVNTEDVRISTLTVPLPPTTTIPQYRDELVIRLGEMAMNRRLDEKVSRGGTSYLSGRVGSGNEPDVMHTAEISGRAAPGKWQGALEELALELQRAREFGFTAREIDDARKQVVSGAERAVETEGTVQAQAIISRINGAVTSGDTQMSPQQRLMLLNELAPSITAEEVGRAFAKEYDPKEVVFVAVLPSGSDVPAESRLLEAGLKALAVKPTREAETTHAAQLMTDLPKPGAVKESEEHAASKVWSAWLGNNVRVHYRQMDTRENEVSINISLFGAELLETAANRGITQAAQLAWSRPATKSLTSSDIRELMTGKKIGVRGGGMGGGGGRGRGGRGGGGGGGGPASISLSISGSPEELETGFQLAYLLLTEPRIEPVSFTQFQTAMRQALEASTRNPAALGARTAASAPYPDDEPRVHPPTPEQIDKLTVESAQAWLEKLIKESPIEVAIVGDVKREQVMELVNRYIGSLPTRDRITPAAFASLRTLQRPAGPRIIEKTLETETAQAFVLSGFYGVDASNLADTRAMNVAARVLSSRMVKQVREEAQLVYSIGAQSQAATVFPGFGTFAAAAPTEPSKAAPLLEKLASMYEVFAKDGPTDDEMQVARKQFANTFEEQMKDPGYWRGRLDDLTFRGDSLDDIVNGPAAYQAITAGQVRDAFAKYYSKQNSIVVVVRPEKAAAADKKAHAEPPVPAAGAGS